MQSEFLAYKEEASKRMEEIRKKIESFSPPHTSPASQASHITPTSPAATVTKKRKKRAVKAAKIHLHRRPTKPPSTGRKSAHLGRKCRRHWTQPSKRVVINSRRASMHLGVTRVHCGAREVKKRAFVFAWFRKRKKEKEEEEEEVANFCAEDDGSFWSHWIKLDAVVHAEEALVPRAARNTKSYVGANKPEMRKKKGPEPQERVQKRRKADNSVPAAPMIEGAISGVLPWGQGRC
jgi:hypothetical protein